MYAILVVFHVIACIALILIVLLQTGKGADMGAAFGGASSTLFGSGGGSTFLSKLTTGAAVVFMLTCLSLTYLSSAPVARSVMEDVPVEKPQGPALPEAKPVLPGQMPTAPQGAVNPPAGPAARAPEAPKTQESAQPTPPAAQEVPRSSPPAQSAPSKQPTKGKQQDQKR